MTTMATAPAGSPLVAAAHAYAVRGLFVFPCYELTADGTDCACPSSHPSRDAAGHCGSPGKHPRTPHGVKDASTDLAQIARWWLHWPRAHVALATGPSGLLVIDVDPRNDGDQSLHELEAEFGPLPDTPRQLTGGGGLHLLFRRPDRPTVRGPRHGLGQGLDIKADGGYIIAAPSSHLSGRPYAWELGTSLEDLPLADVPTWLLARLDTRTLRAAPSIAMTAAVTDGLLGAALATAGWLGRPLGLEKAAARCPNEDHHSTGSRFNGSSIVYAPRKPGGLGWFHCSHSHCTTLSPTEVLDALPTASVTAARASLAARGVHPDPLPDVTPPLPDADAPPPRDQPTPIRPLGKRVRAHAGDLALLLTTDPAWAGCLEYDPFADRITWARPAPVLPGLYPPQLGATLQDTDLTYLAHWAATARGWSLGPDAVLAAATSAAHSTERHPVRDYLAGLTWDGCPRLATWLTTYAGAPDDPTTTAIGVWTLVSAVARIFRPGCQADHVLILEGPQALGKSSLIRTLAGPFYLPQLPNLLADHAALYLQGRWLIEIGELDAFRGIAVSRIKDFISRPTDIYRPPYARCTITRPRQCIFLGSTNDDAYLRDPSGGRRFWPVQTTTIALDRLQTDRDQLWAEATHEFAAGTPWWPSDAWSAPLRSLQDSRFESDPWEPTITAYLAGLPSVSTTELLESALHIPTDRLARADQMRVADVLKHLGWSRRHTGPSRSRRWFPPPS